MSAIAPVSTTCRVSDLPHPPALPGLGSLHLARMTRFHLILEHWAEKLGTPYLFQLGSIKLVVWRDSELFQQLLRERPHRWRRYSTFEPIAKETGCNGLFSVEGPAWEPQRRLVVAALASGHFRTFFPAIQTITERLRRRWEAAARRGEVLQMSEELKRYTVDVTGTLAFGEDLNTIERGAGVIQQHLALIFPTMMSRIFAPIPYWRYFRLPRDRRFDASLVEVHRYVAERIANARRRMADDPADSPRNLLEAMIGLSDAPDSGFDERDLSANVLTLLLAGEDTTANMLAWTMPYLCADAMLQDKLYRETVEHFGSARVCPDYELVRSLGRFEALATEASRFRPTVPMDTYESTEPVVLGGVALQAGSPVVILKRPDMLDEKHFEHPGTYDPERWLRTRDERTGPHEQRAYLQFGAGARVCPGRHLAGVEMRMVLSMLTRNFTAQLATAPENIEEVMAFTMKPSMMPVRLTPREAG